MILIINTTANIAENSLMWMFQPSAGALSMLTKNTLLQQAKHNSA